MFHPFKKLEAKWNAHTPRFLHNRTKENFIFQLLLTVLFILGMLAYDKYEERKLERQRQEEEKVVPMQS